ncbi:unnamed protein product [Moneuplotes crassus]|uniref:Uncharacterized protein n=1 Tax=Euplotes crassus TaxID=5936 RepID=A0AAD2DCP9_EUPCR|nr:unnamed protein product [Moneuplotes crassus]
MEIEQQTPDEECTVNFTSSVLEPQHDTTEESKTLSKPSKLDNMQDVTPVNRSRSETQLINNHKSHRSNNNKLLEIKDQTIKKRDQEIEQLKSQLHSLEESTQKRLDRQRAKVLAYDELQEENQEQKCLIEQLYSDISHLKQTHQAEMDDQEYTLKLKYEQMLQDQLKNRRVELDQYLLQTNPNDLQNESIQEITSKVPRKDSYERNQLESSNAHEYALDGQQQRLEELEARIREECQQEYEQRMQDFLQEAEQIHNREIARLSSNPHQNPKSELVLRAEMYDKVKQDMQEEIEEKIIIELTTTVKESIEKDLKATYAKKLKIQVQEKLEEEIDIKTKEITKKIKTEQVRKLKSEKEKLQKKYKQQFEEETKAEWDKIKAAKNEISRIRSREQVKVKNIKQEKEKLDNFVKLKEMELQRKINELNDQVNLLKAQNEELERSTIKQLNKSYKENHTKYEHKVNFLGGGNFIYEEKANTIVSDSEKENEYTLRNKIGKPKRVLIPSQEATNESIESTNRSGRDYVLSSGKSRHRDGAKNYGLFDAEEYSEDNREQSETSESQNYDNEILESSPQEFDINIQRNLYSLPSDYQDRSRDRKFLLANINSVETADWGVQNNPRFQ